MPRRNLILSDTCAYHITNRSNNREWFYIPPPQLWDVFCKILSVASSKYETEIHSFVLMSNHYHLILATREKNLNQFMRYFQTEVCREIQRHSSRINHIFGGRYKWSLLWNSFAYAVATKYVLRNPIKAGISTSVETHPFSSIHSEAAQKIPLVERIDSIANQIPKNHVERLNWLNTPTSTEADELVRRGLRHFEFSLTETDHKSVNQELVSLRYQVSVDKTHLIPF